VKIGKKVNRIFVEKNKMQSVWDGECMICACVC